MKKLKIERSVSSTGVFSISLKVYDKDWNFLKEFDLLLPEDREEANSYLLNITSSTGGIFTQDGVAIICFGDFCRSFKWKSINLKYDNLEKLKKELENRYLDILKWKLSLIKTETIEFEIPDLEDIMKENYNFEEL